MFNSYKGNLPFKKLIRFVGNFGFPIPLQHLYKVLNFQISGNSRILVAGIDNAEFFWFSLELIFKPNIKGAERENQPFYFPRHPAFNNLWPGKLETLRILNNACLELPCSPSPSCFMYNEED